MNDEQAEQFDLLHVAGSKMGDLRYTDDAAMISKSRSGLNKYVTSLNEKSKDYGLKMNASKKKVMAVVKEDERDVEKVNADGSELEEVDNLRYLGM